MNAVSAFWRWMRPPLRRSRTTSEVADVLEAPVGAAEADGDLARALGDAGEDALGSHRGGGGADAGAGERQADEAVRERVRVGGDDLPGLDAAAREVDDHAHEARVVADADLARGQRGRGGRGEHRGAGEGGECDQ
jgi:hypothetical protein